MMIFAVETVPGSFDPIAQNDTVFAALPVNANSLDFGLPRPLAVPCRVRRKRRPPAISFSTERQISV